MTKKALKEKVARDIRAVFTAESLDEAQKSLQKSSKSMQKTQSNLSEWRKENIPEGLTVFAFPETVRQFLRTNNREENLKNKSKKERD